MATAVINRVDQLKGITIPAGVEVTVTRNYGVTANDKATKLIECGCFRQPEYEVADIQAHLRALLADPGAFRRMGERGRQALRRHDPEEYVDALAEFAATAIGSHRAWPRWISPGASARI